MSTKILMPRDVQWYGWIPDTPDHRDHRLSFPKNLLGTLPARWSLQDMCPPVYNQEELGSCTANAIGAAFQMQQMKQDRSKAFMPSRLFIYYNERVMQGTVHVDSGATIRDGIKSVVNQGVCPETIWPYHIRRFRDRPDQKCYDNALKNQVVEYMRVSQDVGQIKAAIAAGFPVIFGFSVYDKFESEEVAKTGRLNLPSKDEHFKGGHAVLAVGYDDALQRFIVRNSWGSDWGRAGYFTMPYEYLANDDLAADFWTIRGVELDAEDDGSTTTTQTDNEDSSCNLLLPAIRAFAEGAVKQADARRKSGCQASMTEEMIESGFRNLCEYLDKVESARRRRKNRNG